MPTRVLVKPLSPHPHCFHATGQPWQIAQGVVGIPETCCHCGPQRVAFFVPSLPEDTRDHGPYLRFEVPSRATGLVVASRIGRG